MMKKTK